MDHDQIYQSEEWPGPQAFGEWLFNVNDVFIADETCVGAFYINFCPATSK
jgi:hypothetical protein